MKKEMKILKSDATKIEKEHSYTCKKKFETKNLTSLTYFFTDFCCYFHQALFLRIFIKSQLHDEVFYSFIVTLILVSVTNKKIRREQLKQLKLFPDCSTYLMKFLTIFWWKRNRKKNCRTLFWYFLSKRVLIT